MPNPKRKYLLLAIAMVLLLPLAFSGQDNPSQLEQVLQRGSLQVLTRNGASSYYLGADGPTGPEYELAKSFADYLGVELEITVTKSFSGLEGELNQQRGDLIAANLTRTPEREMRFNFGPDYLDTTTDVIYRRGSKRPDDVAGLVGMNIMVIAGSSYEEVLRELKADHPGLEWQAQENTGIEELLLAVSDGAIDATLVDSNIYRINRPFYPRVASAFELDNSLPHAWAFRNGSDDTLVQKAHSFMLTAREAGLLEAIEKQFYSYPEQLGQVSMRQFLIQVRARLPELLPYFRETANRVGMDWRLIAAIGYQESQWDPEAVSFTGVRGIMMLTRQTARQVGIDDRLDPEQSIYGGAKYFLELYQRLPDRIDDPDRVWFTLAAYNLGMGHLEDVRILTETLGGNPDVWADVEESLDLLSQERYYSELRHGYARGFEARKFVANVQRYYDTLRWMDTRAHPLLATQEL
ncbi:MAG TPA: membrane-bound lytic murein transglycosylase MltF [Xanthomonadales bacterium]|nr:membrane-bound lytic murein transglycosylase MltF [Xanthomonadales bacterium]